jgi:hypothetical protein
MKAKQLYQLLYKKLSEKHSREMPVIKISKIIRDHIGHNISVTTQRDPSIELNELVVIGKYDPEEDEAGLPCINLYIVCNNGQGKFTVSTKVKKQLCMDVVECVGHQLVHQQQFRSRKFEIHDSYFVGNTVEQEYLGNPDEIEAYGYSIAALMYLKHPPIKVQGVLIGKILTTNFFAKSYIEHFGNGHPILIKLIKYSTEFYNQLLETDTTEKTNMS